jgi:NAD(P)-dependent dehydrogenase (short-subunit alcohol dehydrogenase family)
MGRLEGKTVLITGASGGIGAASARLFVAEGANVTLVDRDEGALRALSTEFGDRALMCAADVSSSDDTQRYVAATLDRFGALHALFANAGIEGTVAPVHETAVEAFDRVIAVNVRGVFLGIKHAAPHIARAGGGSIVITSSVAGLLGSPGLAAYVTSKHGIIGLARAAALDLAPMRIRVNTVNPGPVDNRMMRGIEEQISPGHGSDVKTAFQDMVPLGRYGTNEEIALLALFLTSDESSYCTGSVFMADGGYGAR